MICTQNVLKMYSKCTLTEPNVIQMFIICTCCVLGFGSSKPYIYFCGDFVSRLSSEISKDSGGELSNCGGGAGINSGGGEILTGELSTCRGLKNENYYK